MGSIFQPFVIKCRGYFHLPNKSSLRYTILDFLLSEGTKLFFWWIALVDINCSHHTSSLDRQPRVSETTPLPFPHALHGHGWASITQLPPLTALSPRHASLPKLWDGTPRAATTAAISKRFPDLMKENLSKFISLYQCCRVLVRITFMKHAR